MIDEVKIFQELEDGTSVFMDDIYYVATIFTKRYAPDGLGVLDIRQKVEEWARKHNIFILNDINLVINRFISRRMSLTTGMTASITRRDINYIADHVTTMGRRRVLFALMVYGKVYHDEIGNFRLPVKTFARWMKYADPSNLYTRHFPWLIQNNFMEDVTKNYEVRGYTMDDGVLIFKMSSLLIEDRTPVVLEITDNDVMGAFEKIDWKKRY